MTYTILGKIVSDYLQLTLVTSRNWLQIESNFLSHDKSSLSIIRAHNKFNFSSSSTLDSHHLGFIQFQCVSLRHVAYAYVNSGTPPRLAHALLHRFFYAHALWEYNNGQTPSF